MVTPDGMGADRYNERQNMKDAQQETRTPPWELAALDATGAELYRTEYFEDRDAAASHAKDLNDGGIPSRLDDDIARFEPRRSE